jgi:hypothetical protein
MDPRRFLRRSRTATLRPRFQPQLEALEERLVMNNRFVVPLAQADNVTKFATLQAALKTAVAGDVIQIEKGAVPGDIADADVPEVANLTIQGDPSVRAEDLTIFNVKDLLVIDTPREGMTLRNLHVGIAVDGIEMEFADATITDCNLQCSAQQSAGIVLSGSDHSVITNNELDAVSTAGNSPLMQVLVGNGEHNLISGNTLKALAQQPASLLQYVSEATHVQIADRVVHNTFIGNGSSTDPLFQFLGNAHGLDIEANSFIDNTAGPVGLKFDAIDVQASIINNTFALGASADASLSIVTNIANAKPSFLIAGNRFDAGNTDTGLKLVELGAGSAIQARVEGNDFHNLIFGVVVATSFTPNNNNDTSGIDLGGGSQGSLGGNDFRSFTVPANISEAAILDEALSTQGTIQAQHNLFSVSDPSTVIFDHSSNPNLGTVVSTNNLTGNAAFVESLYLQFLHRAGDTTNLQDAGGWVNFLNHGGSPNTVADGVIRSQEALGLQVEDLYQRLLGRDAAANEQALWAQQIQNGRTLESVTELILSSPEYQARFVNDADFVQSLYRGVLHRDGSAAEIAAWLTALPTVGRAGVIGAFVTSQEFRTDVIGEDYSLLLHRFPRSAEVNGWLATGLDALSIDRFFATSPEFPING